MPTARPSRLRRTTPRCSRTTSSRRRRERRIVTGHQRGWLAPLALVAVILVAWEAYVRLAGVAPVVLPAPLRIADALWTFRADAVRHAIPTAIETVVGFGLAVVLAIGAAAAMDRV